MSNRLLPQFHAFLGHQNHVLEYVPERIYPSSSQKLTWYPLPIEARLSHWRGKLLRPDASEQWSARNGRAQPAISAESHRSIHKCKTHKATQSNWSCFLGLHKALQASWERDADNCRKGWSYEWMLSWNDSNMQQFKMVESSQSFNWTYHNPLTFHQNESSCSWKGPANWMSLGIQL